MSQLLTIGHSTHPIERFIDLLAQHSVEAVADVRSTPASRFAPQFNREALRSAVEAAGLRYVFLGKELGARSSDPNCYIDGKVQYGRLATTPAFETGIDHLIDGAARGRVVVMCSEQEPLECHRAVLISQVLTGRGVQIAHIHGDGSLETHEDAMVRLRARHHRDHPSLLHTDDELLAEALQLQEAEIAYVDGRLMAGS